jgi:signal transduction histidine kinase
MTLVMSITLQNLSYPQSDIRQSDESILRFLQSCDEPALIRDRDGRITWRTTSLIHLLELEPTSMPHDMLQWLVYVPDDERETLRSRHRKAISGQASTHTHLLIKDDGEMIRVKSNMIPITGPHPHYVEWFVKMNNYEPPTSDRLPVVKSVDRIRSSVTLLSQEVRSPLAGIMGFAELIHDELPRDTSLSTHVDWLLHSADQLNHVIDKWLEATSIEADMVTQQARYHSLRHILAPALELYHQQAKEKKLYLHVSWPDYDMVYTDAHMLSSIFRHLVDNAIKFTSTGGVSITIENRTQTIGLTIKDSGIGFDMARLPSLLEPFVQESEGMTRRYRGCGLGLSIVNAYLDRLNGTMRFNSVSGEGTTVSVDLPMTIRVGHQEFDACVRCKRIMLVDQDLVSQLIIRRLLRNEWIDACLTAEEALERIKSIQYDAFIIDEKVGKTMTAKQLGQVLRMMDTYKQTPIAVLKSESATRLIDQSVFTHQLTKPFQPKQLLSYARFASGHASKPEPAFRKTKVY